MGRKIDPADKDEAVELYLAGQSLKEAAAALGMKSETLSSELDRRGIQVRGRALVVPAEIIARYVDGESALSLERETGIGRQAIVREVQRAGHDVRGRSAAGVERNKRMSSAERAAQTFAANVAAKGRKATVAERVKRAKSLELQGSFGSPSERRLGEWLYVDGVDVIPQKAIGIYNVDLAVGPVAVEVLGGEWHGYKRTHRKRTEAILDAGWHMVFVWDTANYPLDAMLAGRYIVDFVKEASGDPAAVREYRVIRGDGEEMAVGSADDDGFAFVPPARGSAD